jgi:hypothetical protein
MFSRRRAFVKATIPYAVRQSARPRNYVGDPPPGEQKTNSRYRDYSVNILDLDRLNSRLDVEGFELRQDTPPAVDFDATAEIRSKYYPWVAEQIRQATGAADVVPFSHVVRLRARSRGFTPGPEGAGRPIWQPHVDYTAHSAREEARQLTPSAGIERLRIVNVWRLIDHRPTDAPLALCDARSVEPDDLMETDLVYPSRVWETYSLCFNRKHRWHFVRDLGESDILLFKNYDSSRDVTAQFAPHAAIYLPNLQDSAPAPRSIEVRAAIFG